jgi:hypothetical protein
VNPRYRQIFACAAALINLVFRHRDVQANYWQLVPGKRRGSYELDWVLRSIDGRSDYSELTESPELAVRA